MKLSKKNIVITFFFLFTIFNFPLTAQFMERILDSGQIEVGYQFMTHNRSFDTRYKPENMRWDTQSFYLRYGFLNSFTAKINFFVLDTKDVENYPSRDYRNYDLGLGISYRVYSYDMFSWNLSLRYDESLYFDKSMDRFQKQIQSIYFSLETQYVIISDPFDGSISFSPAYLLDKVDQFSPRKNYSEKSKNNVGFSIGIDLLFFNHAHSSFQYIYTDYSQTYFNCGWIF